MAGVWAVEVPFPITISLTPRRWDRTPRLRYGVSVVFIYPPMSARYLVYFSQCIQLYFPHNTLRQELPWYVARVIDHLSYQTPPTPHTLDSSNALIIALVSLALPVSPFLRRNLAAPSSCQLYPRVPATSNSQTHPQQSGNSFLGGS
jgi:hypothetical protein